MSPLGIQIYKLLEREKELSDFYKNLECKIYTDREQTKQKQIELQQNKYADFFELRRDFSSLLGPAKEKGIDNIILEIMGNLATRLEDITEKEREFACS